MKVMKENRSQCKIFHPDVRFFTIRRGILTSAIHLFSIVIHPFRCFSTFPGSNLASIGCVNGPIRGLNHQQRRDRPSKRPKKGPKEPKLPRKRQNFKSIKISMSSGQDKLRWLIIHDAFWYDSIWHLETTKSSCRIKKVAFDIFFLDFEKQVSEFFPDKKVVVFRK